MPDSDGEHNEGFVLKFTDVRFRVMLLDSGSGVCAWPVMRCDLVLALAREHGLTAYDATYLELALRVGAVLATFDGKLADAMRRAGGTVFGDI